MNKKILIPVIIVLAVIGIVLFGRFGIKLGEWEYDSYEEFSKNFSVRFPVDIPENAKYQRFYCKNTGLGSFYICAFTLEKDDYNKLINPLIAEYRSKGEDYYPKWFLMKVGDAHYPDYSLYDFPVHLAFDKVGAGDIRNYVIIQYSPVGTGTSGHGLVANPDTGRIVIYREGHIR